MLHVCNTNEYLKKLLITPGPVKATSETSRQSVAGSTASSEKTSTVTKTSIGSVGFNLNGSKTMDMFDSNTNLTSNADTDNKGSDDVSPTGESTGFTWSAIKAHKEADSKGKMYTGPKI